MREQSWKTHAFHIPSLFPTKICVASKINRTGVELRAHASSVGDLNHMRSCRLHKDAVDNSVQIMEDLNFYGSLSTPEIQWIWLVRSIQVKQ